MNCNKPLPTYKRQRFLLAFITQLVEGITATDLQKLVFLHSMQNEEEAHYDFTPYKYGAYSFQLNQDVTILCDVRKIPISRKFGFSKHKLKHILDTVGIKYVHLPDLGIMSS